MRGKDLYEKFTDIDDTIILDTGNANKSRKPVYIKWLAAAACFALLLIAVPFTSHFFNDQEKSPYPLEIVLNLNDKMYSLVNTDKSPAYENYNLEKQITPGMLGEYLSEMTVQIDNDGNKDTFKLYRYNNAPITEYNWFPRIIAESSDDVYYHALIGSGFNEEKQTAAEVLTVYGLLSARDIVSIENEQGKKIIDKNFIEQFYNGLFTKEYGGNDFLQENVYQNTGIDESEIGDLYSKHADDMIYLKIELSNGLVISTNFTSHNYVEVDHGLYFRVNDSWLDLVSVFK
ncbi:MAG: hypothetical protein EOM03_08970 [Clostridia bacterium]|nr:hypothetical protein [Clostridia bacterium]